MIYCQFPLLPDEHLYSWFVRLYWLSGFPDMVSFHKFLGLSSRSFKSQQLFDSTLMAIAKLAAKSESLKDVIIKSTPMAIWTVSTPQLAKVNASDLESELSKYQHMNEQLMFNFDTSWLSCAVCRDEDTSRYGTSYWHLTHQLPSITRCSKHGERLEVAAEQVKNLYKKTLPHHVEHWLDCAHEQSNSIDEWESFLFNIHKRCTENATFGPRLRKKIEDQLGFTGESPTHKKNQCETLNPLFEIALGQRLLRHLFRFHAKPKSQRQGNILAIILVNHYGLKGVSNPIYWLTLAYWLRDEIKL